MKNYGMINKKARNSRVFHRRTLCEVYEVISKMYMTPSYVASATSLMQLERKLSAKEIIAELYDAFPDKYVGLYVTANRLLPTTMMPASDVSFNLTRNGDDYDFNINEYCADLKLHKKDTFRSISISFIDGELLVPKDKLDKLKSELSVFRLLGIKYTIIPNNDMNKYVVEGTITRDSVIAELLAEGVQIYPPVLQELIYRMGGPKPYYDNGFIDKIEMDQDMYKKYITHILGRFPTNFPYIKLSMVATVTDHNPINKLVPSANILTDMRDTANYALSMGAFANGVTYPYSNSRYLTESGHVKFTVFDKILRSVKATNMKAFIRLYPTVKSIYAKIGIEAFTPSSHEILSYIKIIDMKLNYDDYMFIFNKLGSWNASLEFVNSIGRERIKFLRMSWKDDFVEALKNIDKGIDLSGKSVSEIRELYLEELGIPSDDTDIRELCSMARYSDSETEEYVRKYEEEMSKSDNTSDMIPDITIRKGDYTISKVANGSPLGPLLGRFTDCCQHPEGMGSSCAWHGLTNRYGGFYTVTSKEGLIVAQSWVWLCEDKPVLCFDSIEIGYNNSKHIGLIRSLYKELGDRIVEMEPFIMIVVFGSYDNVPHKDKYNVLKTPVRVPYNCYSDAKELQYVISSKPGYEDRMIPSSEYYEYRQANPLPTDSGSLYGELRHPNRHHGDAMHCEIPLPYTSSVCTNTQPRMRDNISINRLREICREVPESVIERSNVSPHSQGSAVDFSISMVRS